MSDLPSVSWTGTIVKPREWEFSPIMFKYSHFWYFSQIPFPQSSHHRRWLGCFLQSLSCSKISEKAKQGIICKYCKEIKKEMVVCLQYHPQRTQKYPPLITRTVKFKSSVQEFENLVLIQQHIAYIALYWILRMSLSYYIGYHPISSVL